MIAEIQGLEDSQVRELTGTLVLYTVRLLRDIHGEDLVFKILSQENISKAMDILDGKDEPPAGREVVE